MAKIFIDTLETGMKLSKSDSVIEPLVKSDVLKQPEVEVVDDSVEEVVEETIVEEVIDLEENKKLKNKVAGKYKTASPDQKENVKLILSKYGTTKLDETKPTEMFKEILAIL
jgi:hypothetical protein